MCRSHTKRATDVSGSAAAFDEAADSQSALVTSDAQYSRRDAIFPSTNSKIAISFMCLRFRCTTSSKYTSHSAMPVVPSIYVLSRVKLIRSCPFTTFSCQ